MKRLIRNRIAFFCLCSLVFVQTPAFSESLSKNTESNSTLAGSPVGKKDWINFTFKNGKKLYDEKKYSEALREWGKLEPYFDKNPAIKKVVLYFESQMKHAPSAPVVSQKPVTEVSAPRPPAPVEAPKEFSQVVSQAGQHFQSEAEDAKSRMAASESVQTENRLKQELVNSAFEKGKDLYSRGNYEAAIKEWERVIPYVEPGSAVNRLVDTLKQNYQALQESQRLMSAVQKAPVTAPEIPGELSSILAQANQKLKQESQAAQSQVSQAQTLQGDNRQKQEFINSAFEQGKFLYYQGKYEAAVDEWSKIIPYLGGSQRGIAESIVSMKENYQVALEARKITAEIPSASKETVFEIPKEFSSLLIEASQRLEKEAQEAKAQLAEVQAAQGADRDQERLKVTFQNGKMLYTQGKYEEAITEWQKITPYVDPDSSVIRLIDTLKKNYADLMKSKEPLIEKRVRAGRLEVPGELTDLLVKANEHLRREAAETQIQLSKVKSAASDKQQFVNETFQKGKTLFSRGQVEEALDVWGSMTPYLENETEIRQAIQRIRVSYQESQTAKKAMTDLSNVQGVKYQAPDDLMGLLAQITHQAQTEAAAVKGERGRMEESIAQKEVWVKSTFVNGRALYQQGKYKEALDQWDLIAPFLENASETKQAIETARASLLEIQKAKKAIGDLHEVETVKYQAPEDLLKILEEASGHFRAEAADTKQTQAERQAQIERTSKELTARMEAIFQKGKVLYYQSHYEDAIGQWDKLVPYVDENSGIKKQIDILKTDYQSLLEAQKSLADTSAKVHTPVDPSYVSGITQAIRSADQKLQTEVQEAELQKTTAQKTLVERQAWIDETFQKGKKLYAGGKFYEAVEQWDKIAAYLDDKSDTKARIRELKETFQKVLAAKKEAIDAVAHQDAHLNAPEEFSLYLTQVNQKLEADSQDALAQKQKADQTFSERQTWITATFQNGKALYESGKVSEALAQWSSLTPYLTNASEIKEYLEIVSKSYAQFSEARKLAQASADKTQVKFQAPLELGKILTQVNQKLEADFQDALAQKQKADQTFSERRTWITATFQNGKALYESGKVSEALAQWTLLVPYLADGSQIDEYIQLIGKSQAQSVEAKNQFQDALGKKDIKSETPKEFSDLLTQANQKLQVEAAEAQAKRAEMEKALVDRQTWVNSTFENGKSLYENGKYEEAIGEWEKLTPYLDEKSGIKEVVNALKQNYYFVLQAKKEALEAGVNQVKDLTLPKDVNQIISGVNTALDKQIKESQSAKQKAEQVLADRQTFVKSTFEKGKAFYAEGKLPEALDQWNALLPYLDEKSDAKQLIGALKQTCVTSLETRKAAQDAQDRQAVKFNLSKDFTQAFEQANQRLVALSRGYQSDQTKAEQTLADRQAWVRSTFEKGRAFSTEGKWAEAIDQWNLLDPHLDEKSEAKQLIGSVKQNYTTAIAFQKSALEAQGRQEAKFDLTEDFIKIFEQTNQKIINQIEQSGSGKQKAEQVLADRQAWVRSTFEKGRAFSAKGKWAQALEQWSLLDPYLDEKSEAKRLIDLLKQNYAVSLEAQKVAQDAQSRQAVKFNLSKDFTQAFEQANQRLIALSQEYKSEKQKVEKAIADRKAWIQATFEKGREFFSVDKYDEAIAEWSKLLPYMEDKDMMQKILETLKQSNVDAGLAKRAVIDFTANEYNELKFPYAGEMLTLLNESNQKLQDQTQRSQAQRADMEKSISDRQAWIQMTYERGKALNAAGKIDEALVQWASLTPYLEDEPQIKQALQSVQQSYSVKVEAHKLAQDALGKKDMKFQTPKELGQLLAQANQHLQAETQAAVDQKTEAEKALSDRQAWIKAAFENGKALYADGKITDAFKEWNSITPHLVNEEEIKEYIQIVAKSRTQSITAKNQAQDALGKKDTKFQAPAELGQLLTQANEELQAHTQASADEKVLAEKTLSDRQAWIQAAFEKGKVFYADGKITDALAQWNSIASYLVNEDQIKEYIQIIAKSQTRLIEAKNQAQNAMNKKDMKFQAPQELARLLVQADKQLQADTQAAAGQKAEAEKTLADRQAWIQAAFEKGKAFHAAGKYMETAEEWSKVLPYLDDKDSVAKAIDALKQSDTNAILAKRAVIDFTANQYNQLKFPHGDEMADLLNQAIQKLRADGKKAEGQRAEMEKALTFRQGWIQATFEKGKALYTEGKFVEASEQWNSIAPYLDNESKIKALIQDLQYNFNHSLEAKKAFRDVESRRDMRCQPPADLEILLTQADQKLSADAKLAKTQKAELDKALSDRRIWIQTAFDKGRVLYETGKYKEAFDEWESMAPYLENEPKLKEAIQTLRQTHAKAAESDQLAQEALSKKDMKFPVPQDLPQLLAQATQKLNADAQTAMAGKIETDKTIVSRQKLIQSTFEKGQALYQSGKISEALVEWSAVLPSVDEADQLQASIEKVQRNYAASVQLSKDARDAELRKSMKLEAPPELQNILSQAVQKLETDGQASQAKRAQMEKEIADRQAWINATFEKGRNLFYAGKYKEALDLWGALSPYLVNGAELKDAIEGLNVTAAKVDLVKQSSESVRSKYDVKFQAPIELPRLLSLVTQQMQDEAYDAESQKLKAEATFKDRQAFIAATFQSGKALYDEHKFKEAVDEWSKLTPYLEEKSPARPLFDVFYQNYSKSVESKTAAIEAVAQDYKGLKIPYAEQISKLLESANQQMQIELDAQAGKREAMEKAIADRREWSATTFNKGKIFYEQGQLEQAIEQWDRLTPYLDEQSVIRGLIGKFKKRYAEISMSKKQIENMTQIKDTGLEPARLDEMVRVLEAANQKFKVDINQSNAELKEIEKTVNEKQTTATAVFDLGKKLYDAGRTDEAFTEWERLEPLFKTFPKIETAVHEAKENYRKELAVKKAIADGSTKAQTLVSLETSLSAAKAAPLSDAGQAAVSQMTAAAVAQTPPPAPVTFSEVSTASEFVSGEIAEIDNTKKTLTVKLYTAGKDKAVTVNFDAATEMIVNGEKGKSTASLQSGAAVDLRYDPSTKKALYIYAY